MINFVTGIRPIKKNNNTNNNNSSRRVGALCQLSCDTVQFRGIIPLKPVHQELRKKANELEVVLSKTTLRDDAVSLRNIIDDLTSGHYSGTILGDSAKDLYKDQDFIDGDLVRTTWASSKNKSKTVTEHLPTGDHTIAYNVNGTLVKEVVNHPDTFKPNTSVFYDMHTGVPSEERGTELDGSLRFLSTRFPSYDEHLSTSLGIKGSKYRYDCTIDGQLKSSKIMDKNNQLLATLHYRDDKTLDFARVFDSSRKSVVKVVEFDEEGILPVKTEIP